jgi:hypothetical protein
MPDRAKAPLQASQFRSALPMERTMQRMCGQKVEGSSIGRRLMAAGFVVLCLASIVVHGKASRSPKLIVAEAAETIRTTDRPQTH